MLTTIKNIIILIISAYILFLICAYFLTDSVIFSPRTHSYKDNSNILKLTTKDGASISAIYLPNPKATYTLLFSHGNAEDLNYLLPMLHLFQQHGFSVFAYDYHGYGTSTGYPNEKNIYNDINVAYVYLTQYLNISPTKIIAFGHSIGAAASIELAAHKKLGGLIVQSAFLSATRVITKIPLVPFDKWNNYKKIKSIACPIFFIHGTRDTIVPFWHAQKLYDAAIASKQYLWIVGAGHNDLLNIAGENYWYAIDNFLRRNCRYPKEKIDLEYAK